MLSATLRRGVDAALEETVVLSWSRIGYLTRRHLWGWEMTRDGSLTGRSFLVTGGTSGIGRSVATALARGGALVGIVGRDETRLQQAARDISAEASSRHVWAASADMGKLDDVRSLPSLVASHAGKLDGLVHCAGSLFHTFDVTAEGIERTAAVHVIGPHLLTTLLLDHLRAAGDASVVWLSSGGMYTNRLDVDRLDDKQGYRGANAYARAKRAQVVLADTWERRLRREGLRVYAMHPGWVDTAALREGLPRFYRLMKPLLRRPAEGADTAVWLASGMAPRGSPASFWLDRRPRPEHRLSSTRSAPGESERLWNWCQHKSGLDQPSWPRST